MKNPSFAVIVGILSIIGVSSVSHVARANGYVVDSAGNVVRGSTGLCAHTTSWTPADAIVGCDGKTADAAPMPPAPPPPPAAMPPAPPVDSDGDGVPDSVDKCAATPAGMQVDANGCPPDADGDGVADYLDKCPGTPKGAVVDEVGCPKKLDHEVSINLDITFVTNKAEIKSDATPEIAKVAKFMKEYPEVKITIEGYTDNKGGKNSNKTLSQKRADAVQAALIAGGIDGTRLNAVGYGMENPVADNATEEGRAQNRRVVAHAKVETQVIEMKKKPKAAKKKEADKKEAEKK